MSNPFKMWGSWVGAVIGLIVWLYDYDFLMNPAGPTHQLSNYIRDILGITTNLSSFTAVFLPPIILIILGFLIGWIIHSLIRRKK